MGEIIIENAIKRERGFLYYINREGDICGAKMKRGGKKRLQKKCKYCGEEFGILNKSKRIFCSKECAYQSQLMNLKQKGYKQGLIKEKCIICNKDFNKNNSQHKICSDECREKYHKSVQNFTYFENVSFQKLPKNFSWLKLRFEIFKRDNFTCQYCGRNVKKDRIKLHLDHVIPKDKGGRDIIKNLITSCEECNLGKRDIILQMKVLNRKGARNDENNPKINTE